MAPGLAAGPPCATAAVPGMVTASRGLQLDWFPELERGVGTKQTGKGRRKLGRKKRRMRSKIRHRKG